MRIWFTTHWPHLRDMPRDAPHSRVWVADDKRDVIAPMEIGDLVWIYESQSGRDIVKQSADGTTEKWKHHHGRGGVVTLAEVTSKPIEHPDSEREQYSDGTSIWWRWYSETRVVNSVGFVDRDTTNEILGYKASYPFKGFGTRHSGLKEIIQDEHYQLLSKFLESHSIKDIERLKSSGRLGGEGGEGPVHLALKNYVATKPEEALNEPGLELVKMEFPFGSTGDRIDVLLKDQFGRFVAVEVEPSCDEHHDAGPLQCMKYRSLLAYSFGRQQEEVRAVLIAHEIHEDVQAKCRRYEIECLEIERSCVSNANQV